MHSDPPSPHPARCAAQVRNAALHVWKSVVVNTPRTLQDILPALMGHLVSGLAAEGARAQGWALGHGTRRSRGLRMCGV
jgi:hypothetical protein